MSEEEAVGSHKSTLRPDGVMFTMVRGRVPVEMIRGWGRDWDSIDGAKIWLIDAMRVSGYEAEAVAEATRLMTRLKSKGLEVVIAATRSTLVKYGAAVVKKTLHIAVGIDVQVVESMQDAERSVTQAVAARAS